MDCSQGDRLCTECCKWLTFIITPSPQNFKEYMDFYKQRGAKIEQLAASVAITVPATCPHLSITGCMIHEKKPKLCKEYDCRQDPFLKGGKYYEQ